MLAVFTLIFCVSSLAIDKVRYYGNYSVYLRLTDESIVLDESSLIFQHDLPTPENCADGLELLLSFDDSDFLEIGSFLMTGYTTPEKDYYFFYATYPTNSKDFQLAILRETLADLGGVNCRNYTALHQALQTVFSDRKTTVYIAAFNVSNVTDSAQSHFMLDERAVGVFGVDVGRAAFNISGNVYDERAFVIEGKMFGVLMAIGVFASYVAWTTLEESFSSIARLSQLSVRSFEMHIAFDFSYSLFVFNLAELNNNFSGLYILLFVMMLMIYFGIEMRQLLEVWKVSLGDVNALDQVQLRQMFITMFMELSVVLFIMSIASSLIFELPYLSIIVLYGFFLPQITHSIDAPVRKTKDTLFVIIIGIFRLLPVFYFTLYEGNLQGTYAPGVAIFASIYVGGQIIFVLLQNLLGGAFFLKESMRPEVFNYRSRRPEDGTDCAICLSVIAPEDDCMITPCGHAFHSECLLRWMDEQMICPTCRESLPGVSGEDHEP